MKGTPGEVCTIFSAWALSYVRAELPGNSGTDWKHDEGCDEDPCGVGPAFLILAAVYLCVRSFRKAPRNRTSVQSLPIPTLINQMNCLSLI